MCDSVCGPEDDSVKKLLRIYSRNRIEMDYGSAEFEAGPNGLVVLGSSPGCKSIQVFRRSPRVCVKSYAPFTMARLRDAIDHAEGLS